MKTVPPHVANNIDEPVSSNVTSSPEEPMYVDETKGKAKIIELSGAWKEQHNKKLMDTAVVEIPLDDVNPIQQCNHFKFIIPVDYV